LPQKGSDIKESFIYLDDLVLMSERSRFSTDGPVKFVSEDALMLGRALEGVYSGQFHRLEYLRIVHLESLRLKSSKAALFAGTKTQTREPADIDSQTKTEQPDEPVAAHDAEKAKAPPPKTSTPAGKQEVAQSQGQYYRCAFSKNVVIDAPEQLVFADDQISISDILWAKDTADKPDKADSPSTDKAQPPTQIPEESAVSPTAETGKARTAPVADQNEPGKPSEQPLDIVVTCDNGILVTPMDSTRSIKDFPGPKGPPASANSRITKVFEDTTERPRLIAREIDHCASTEETVAAGPLELTFDVNDPMVAGPNGTAVPVKVTANKQGRFLPASNRVIFEGDSVCTMLREDPNIQNRYTLSGPRLTVDLFEDKPSAGDSAPQIKHLTANGGVVRLATIKMAVNQEPNFVASPANQTQDVNSPKSLGGVELKCRRFDFDAVQQMFLATGPGVIKVDNSKISEPNSDPNSDPPNSTRDRFSMKKPCFAVVQDFDTLRYLLEPNLLIADATSQQIRIGYVPIVKAELGRPVNATAAHVEALLYETADNQLELSTLTASGGITYEDGDKEFAGSELFYDADKSLVTVHGDQSWPCRLNGARVDRIEYDLKADKVKARVVAPGAFQNSEPFWFSATMNTNMTMRTIFWKSLRTLRMHMGLNKSVFGIRPRPLLLSVAAVLAFVLASCRQRPVEQSDNLARARTKEHVRAHLTHLRTLKEASSFAGVMQLCQEMISRMDNHGAAAVTKVPDLFSLCVVEDQNRGKTALFVRYLERKSDLLGVRVREYWPNGRTVSEIYELDRGTRSLLPKDRPNSNATEWSWVWGFALDITPRKSTGLRKDLERWKTWVEQGTVEGRPPMYIARPSAKTHVLISLIDEKGHESRAVPLTCWIVETAADNPVKMKEFGNVREFSRPVSRREANEPNNS
jgi:hypothetical protein